MKTTIINYPAVEPEVTVTKPEQRTQLEITALFNHWKADPCFDLEDADGFEAHREQLKGMRLEHEDRLSRQAHQRLANEAIAVGVPDNLVLAAHLLVLENRINQLEITQRAYSSAFTLASRI